MKDKDIFNTVVSLRRKIHQHPELGHEEFKTTQLVTDTLNKAKIPFKRFRPTGALATLKGNRLNPCVAIRADMDALPLQERAQWPYRSKTSHVMHACGHDGHTAMALTAALCLAEEKESLPGTVKFIFQPDEEGSGGARRLLNQKIFKAPKVDAVFGIHVNPRLPAGTIGIKSGPLMAAVDKFTLEIYGQGGHGAYPHEGRDAVVIASHVIQALQSLVARQVDPMEPAVVTVGTIQGGDRFNILAEKVTMTGTVRTFSKKCHRHIQQLIVKTVHGLVQSMGGTCRLNYQVLSLPVINHKGMAQLAKNVAEKVVGKRKVISLTEASMGGEDFSEYLQDAPGAFIFLGTGANQKTRKPWHHPEFFLHEPSLPVGVRYFCALAKEALKAFD